MGTVKDLLSALKDVSALQAKTKDLNDGVLLLGNKIDPLVERLAVLETNYSQMRKSIHDEIMADIKAQMSDRITTLESDHKHLQQSVKNEILADIKADIAVTQTKLNHHHSAVLEVEKQSK